MQSHIIQEMNELGIVGDQRFEYLKQHILVKEDKKHRCYHFLELFEDLKNLSAEDFARAIKGKPENLQCKTAFDLLFIVPTRFHSVNSFRECLMQKKEDIDKI